MTLYQKQAIVINIIVSQYTSSDKIGHTKVVDHSIIFHYDRV